MRAEDDAEWPKTLLHALLSANSHRKRSTDYSPFCLMFGREFDHISLFRCLNSKDEHNSTDEEDTSQIEGNNFWTSELEQHREIDRDNARSNIQIEQAE